MMNEIMNKVREVKEVLASNGYAPFDFTVSVEELRNGRAGEAHYFFNRINISKHYLAEHTERILNITVPHEICHLYVGKYFPRAKQHHGREFRYLMNLLGLRGDTYHDMKLETNAHKNKQRKTKIRWIYETVNTKIQVKVATTTHNKIMRGAKFYYTKNREPIVFTGKKIEIK